MQWRVSLFPNFPEKLYHINFEGRAVAWAYNLVHSQKCWHKQWCLNLIFSQHWVVTGSPDICTQYTCWRTEQQGSGTGRYCEGIQEENCKEESGQLGVN